MYLGEAKTGWEEFHFVIANNIIIICGLVYQNYNIRVLFFPLCTITHKIEIKD
jgi:hypothetical protein